MFLRDFANRAYQKGETALGDRLLEESINQLTGIASGHPDNKKVLNELAMSYFYFWNQNNASLPTDSALAWLGSVKEASNPMGCSELDIASRQSVMAGETDEARVYVSRLTEKGYHEPEFKRFCFEHGLCAIRDQ